MTEEEIAARKFAIASQKENEADKAKEEARKKRKRKDVNLMKSRMKRKRHFQDVQTMQKLQVTNQLIRLRQKETE